MQTLSLDELNEKRMNGTLKFSLIPDLPEDWWLAPLTVWSVWDKTDYYLWGANKSNMFLDEGKPLNGGGLASNRGPTRGRAHLHYLGINTMEYIFMSDNVKQFNHIANLIKGGNTIIIPIFNEEKKTPTTYKYSLGTGYGTGVANWIDIQKDILQSIITIGKLASKIDIPDGVYWPDCSKSMPYPHHQIKDLADIQKIVDSLP